MLGAFNTANSQYHSYLHQRVSACKTVFFARLEFINEKGEYNGFRVKLFRAPNVLPMLIH